MKHIALLTALLLNLLPSPADEEDGGKSMVCSPI